MCELAWAAGFFDGEGSTFCMHKESKRRTKDGRPRDYPTLRVQIGQGEREVLDRFASAVGVGKIYYVKAHYTSAQGYTYYKDKWQYQATKDEAAYVLEQLWQWLSEPKRKQAIEAIKFYHAGLEIPRKRMDRIGRKVNVS
jgi:hypothetical protein